MTDADDVLVTWVRQLVALLGGFTSAELGRAVSSATSETTKERTRRPVSEMKLDDVRRVVRTMLESGELVVVNGRVERAPEKVAEQPSCSDGGQ